MPGTVQDFDSLVINNMQSEISTKYKVADVVIAVFPGSVVLSITLPQAAASKFQDDAKSPTFKLANERVLGVYTESAEAQTFAKQVKCLCTHMSLHTGHSCR